MITRLLIRLLRDEDGPTAVEYAVILAVILIAIIQAITAVGNSTSQIWADDVDSISNAISANSGG